MEIPEKGSFQSAAARRESAGERSQPTVEKTDAQSNPKATEKDTVRLTENGHEFKSTVQYARLLPEIREDRVMRLKRQLETGQYRVEGRRIAVNMMDETIENNNLLKHIDTKA